MEMVVENLVYQSKEPFLSEEEVQRFEELIGDIEDAVKLEVNHKIAKEWSQRIMDLRLPDWVDPEGYTWTPWGVSPVVHLRRYTQEEYCSKHQDARYLVEGTQKRAVSAGSTGSPVNLFEPVDQFKLLVYLNDLPEGKSGATRIYIDPKTGTSGRQTEDFIRIVPRRGHFAYYSLDLWHDGERVDSPSKRFVGFRVQYKRV